jgi:DNA-binding MarR family transcriptional regulator
MSQDDKHDVISDLTNLDRVIHEPARLTILSILYVVESADFLFLLRQTGLTRGNLSSHLNKLEQAGYVHIEKMFVDKIPRTLMHLTDEGKAAFDSYRTQMMNALGEL